MANPSKKKGSAFEREVADFLQTNGFPLAERTYVIGLAQDVGDIAGVPGVAIQCKSVNAIDLAGGLDDAIKQAGHAGVDLGVAVFKRRMKPIGRAYAVVELQDLAGLLRRQGVCGAIECPGSLDT